MTWLKRFIKLILSEASDEKRAAIMFIVNEKGLVLSVSRKDDTSKVGLPGGKVDPGETPKEAAARELYEECGLIATNLELVFVHQDEGRYKTFCYIGDVTGTINTLEQGTIRWVDPDVLLNPEFSPFAPYNEKLFKKLRKLGVLP